MTRNGAMTGVLCMAIFFARGAGAGPGDVETGFLAERGVNGWVYAVTPLANGKILVGGDFPSVLIYGPPGIARLKPDGSLDEYFNPSHLRGTVVYSQAVQADGKVVAGGTRNHAGWITRLNDDGSADPLFTPPSIFGQKITKVIVQPDGKILVGGLFSAIGGAPGDTIVRLNSDGTVDATFKATAFANRYDGVSGLRLQPDGKILISAIGLQRLNSDGSLDESFSVPQLDYISVQSFALQSDGKILAGGHFKLSESSWNYNVLRFNADGSMDTNFPPLRRNYTETPAIEVDKNGRALISGTSNSVVEIIRLNTFHADDVSFVAPAGAISQINTIAVDETNNVFIGGGFALPNGVANVARLRSNGSLDTSFAPGFSLTGVFVPAIALDAESRVVAAFAAYSMRGMVVQRFNLHGSIDTNYSMGTLRGEPTALRIQKDGKILAASRYSEGDSLLSELKRFNADGQVDQSFRIRAGVEAINAVIEQPDGKILIAGAFTTIYGRAADRVARLNSDGSIDNSFHSLAFFGSPFVEHDFAQALAVQADGKLLVGLRLGACYCESDRPIAVLRLNSDGSYDSTFDSSEIVPAAVNTMLPLADGKILVGGFQFSYDGQASVPRHGLVRLNSDGSLDRTFTTGLQGGADVRAIAIEQSGKMVLSSAHSILRLNASGSIDSAFKPAMGIRGNQYTTGMALAPDGNIYFHGSFDTVNDVVRPRLARLQGTVIPIPLTIKIVYGRPSFHWTNPALRLQSSWNVAGPYVDVIDAANLRDTHRFYRLKSN